MPNLYMIAEAVIAASLFAIAGIGFRMLLKPGVNARQRRIWGWVCALLLVIAVTYFISIFRSSEATSGLYGAMKIVTALFSVAACAALVIGLSDVLLDSRVDRRTEELHTRQRLLELALKGSPITVFSQDRDSRYTYIFNAPPGYEPQRILGKSEEEVLPEKAAFKAGAAKLEAMRSGEPQRAEVLVEDENGGRWYDLMVEPLRSRGGRIVGTVSVAYDVTSRKEQEKRLRLLMREVTHRSKNLLAVLQAIARQTAMRADNVDDFLSRFSARVIALGKAHDLLIQDQWAGASVQDLVGAQLGHFSDRIGSQISLEGERMLLKSEAAENIGLALHELATNAAKYGALSRDSGRVGIAWRMIPADGGGKAFEMVWAESGGPKVEEPDGFGFGRTMLEKVVGQALNGEVALSFDPAGLRCRIRIPAENVAGYGVVDAAA